MQPYLLKSISLGPIVFRRLLARIPADQYDTALGDDRFTIREVIAHLADWEVLFRGRMEAAYSGANPTIVVLDEGDRAVELRYSETDIHAQLEKYTFERAKTSAFLLGLKPEQFRLGYVHPAFGQMVIEDQANMLVGHDMYHVEQLTEYLNR